MCYTAGLDPENDEIDYVLLEYKLTEHFESTGRIVNEGSQQLSVIANGHISLQREKFVLCDPDLGTHVIKDEVQLVINGQVQATCPYSEMAQPLIDAMSTEFHGRTIEDVREMSYMGRLNYVLDGYNSLNPRDNLDQVVEAARLVCPDLEFKDLVATPEFIGECYVKYLFGCLSEGTEQKFVMGLRNFIRTGKYMQFGEKQPAINLWDHPAHDRAREIVRLHNEAANDEASKQEGQDRRRRKKGG